MVRKRSVSFSFSKVLENKFPDTKRGKFKYNNCDMILVFDICRVPLFLRHVFVMYTCVKEKLIIYNLKLITFKQRPFFKNQSTLIRYLTQMVSIQLILIFSNLVIYVNGRDALWKEEILHDGKIF